MGNTSRTLRTCAYFFAALTTAVGLVIAAREWPSWEKTCVVNCVLIYQTGSANWTALGVVLVVVGLAASLITWLLARRREARTATRSSDR